MAILAPPHARSARGLLGLAIDQSLICDKGGERRSAMAESRPEMSRTSSAPPLARAAPSPRRTARGEGPAPLSFFLIYLVVGCAIFLVTRGGIYTVIAPLGITFGL